MLRPRALRYPTGSGDGTVRVWDPVTGQAVGRPLTGHTSGVVGVALGAGPDGRLLLASASGDGTVRVWDPATGQAVARIPLLASSYAICSAGPFLAVATSRGFATFELR